MISASYFKFVVVLVVFHGIPCSNSMANPRSTMDMTGFEGLTFEPHMEPSNVTSYIETLHSVPDHIFDNAAIIAAMDADEFNRDLYAGSSLAQGTASSSNSGPTGLYGPSEMYTEEFSAPFNFQRAQQLPLPNVGHQIKYNQRQQNIGVAHFRGSPTGQPGVNNGRPYNGIHFISNVIPKNSPLAPKSNQQTINYNQGNNQGNNQGAVGRGHEQSEKNLDIDINTIRGILFQVLKHLDTQEISRKFNGVKSEMANQINSHKRSTSQSSAAAEIAPYQPRHYSAPPSSPSNGYQPSSQPSSPSSSSAPQGLYQILAPRLPTMNYQGKSVSINEIPNDSGRSKGQQHSVGYPTTVDIVGDQGLIAIPLPPNVVKFNYFSKNNIKKFQQPQQQHHQHQQQQQQQQQYQQTQSNFYPIQAHQHQKHKICHENDGYSS